MNTQERVDELTEYLRDLSEKMDNMMLGDAADLIEELNAALYVAYEELGPYQAEAEDEEAGLEAAAVIDRALEAAGQPPVEVPVPMPVPPPPGFVYVPQPYRGQPKPKYVPGSTEQPWSKPPQTKT